MWAQKAYSSDGSILCEGFKAATGTARDTATGRGASNQPPVWAERNGKAAGGAQGALGFVQVAGSRCCISRKLGPMVGKINTLVFFYRPWSVWWKLFTRNKYSNYFLKQQVQIYWNEFRSRIGALAHPLKRWKFGTPGWQGWSGRGMSGGFVWELKWNRREK